MLNNYLPIAAALSAAVLAQVEPRLEFEVASIRPVAPQESRVDVGMHIDGAQVRFNFLSVRDCIRIAFDVKVHQIEGPEWIGSEHFNIAAKVPSGIAQSQVREMLRNLLIDRFGLVFHREKRDTPVYSLVIGRSGLKLKDSPADDEADGSGTARPALDVKATAGAGGLFADLGDGAYFAFADDKLTGHRLPMWRIADVLSNFTDKPVVDGTGVDPVRKFDVSFEVTPEDYRILQIRAARRSSFTLPPDIARLADQPAESLAASVETAGLKLESRRAPVDVIVVERANRTPSEN
jgi:uncharacterized protein (TIGR03435 family)